jgi:hypothetical protein
MRIYPVRFPDDCADLDAVWSSYEKALEYLMGECERCGWTKVSEYRSYDVDNSSFGEYKFAYDGAEFTVDIETYVLDEKPYF